MDPVTQYATDVQDGKIVACRLVQLACKRHIEDLEHQEERGLVWKPDEAKMACDFFPQVLCLPEDTEHEDQDDEEDVAPKDGTRFDLNAWQQFVVGSIFGWHSWRVSKKTGKKRLGTRFRVAYVEIGKGNGKTPLGAGILLYMMIRKKNAQLYCAAVTRDQAKLAFADCVKMVASSPWLRERVKTLVNNLSLTQNKSFIRPISSEKRGLDGKRVQAAVVDELHEHPDEQVVAKVRAGTKGRPDALIFIPTNSGFDRESVCWHYHELSRQVLEGSASNDAWFAFVCHLDCCEECRAKGLTQPNDECPKCDDWKTEGPHWLKPNPNLGVSITWDYLREQVTEAKGLPSQRYLIRRLNFCQWTQQETVGIPIEQWAACKGTHTSASLVGRDCFIGIDLSAKIDLSAVVCVFPRALPKGEGAVKSQDGSTVDWATDVLSYFWMPRKTLFRRAQEDQRPYPLWLKEGHIFDTSGDLVDHDAIVDFIINVLAKKYRIRRIGIDQAGATAVVTRLRSHFGTISIDGKDYELVIEIPQGFKPLTEPTKLVQALVETRNLSHDGNPCLADNIANMGFEHNSWDQVKPVKINQRKRIDGGVALIDAHAALMVTPMVQPTYQVFFLGGRH